MFLLVLLAGCSLHLAPAACSSQQDSPVRYSAFHGMETTCGVCSVPCWFCTEVCCILLAVFLWMHECSDGLCWWGWCEQRWGQYVKLKSCLSSILGVKWALRMGGCFVCPVLELWGHREDLWVQKWCHSSWGAEGHWWGQSCCCSCSEGLKTCCRVCVSPPVLGPSCREMLPQKRQVRPCSTAERDFVEVVVEFSAFPVAPACETKWNPGDGSPAASESLLQWQITPTLCLLWVMFTPALWIFLSSLSAQQKLITEIIFGLMLHSYLSVIFSSLIPGMGAEGFSLVHVQPWCGVIKAVCWG